MTAYYNENDPFVAAWLRELIKANHIAPGDVDTRSIEDVRPSDVYGYTQCHWFAGIGVWSYALRAAGWPDDRAVWTGSCPCQPFSEAGAGVGFDDKRHLWPAWYWLIDQCRPLRLFGEQVSSKSALAWFDLVQTDLENSSYTVRAVDTCAAGFGAPHIRQRLYFVADACGTRHSRDRQEPVQWYGESAGAVGGASGLCATDQSPGRLGSPKRPGLQGYGGNEYRGSKPERVNTLTPGSIGTAGAACGEPRGASATSDDVSLRLRVQQCYPDATGSMPWLPQQNDRISDVPGPCNGFWLDAEWRPCIDGKARAIEPGVEPLVAGAAARVGRLRGYGNAINAEQAKAFIKAYLDIGE